MQLPALLIYFRHELEISFAPRANIPNIHSITPSSRFRWWKGGLGGAKPPIVWLITLWRDQRFIFARGSWRSVALVLDVFVMKQSYMGDYTTWNCAPDWRIAVTRKNPTRLLTSGRVVFYDLFLCSVAFVSWGYDCKDMTNAHPSLAGAMDI